MIMAASTTATAEYLMVLVPADIPLRWQLGSTGDNPIDLKALSIPLKGVCYFQEASLRHTLTVSYHMTATSATEAATSGLIYPGLDNDISPK